MGLIGAPDAVVGDGGQRHVEDAAAFGGDAPWRTSCDRVEIDYPVGCVLGPSAEQPNRRPCPQGSLSAIWQMFSLRHHRRLALA